jgi:quinol monooxygenase YgiN
MSMISVVVKLTAQEGKRDEIVSGFGPMMDHVETEEGTLTYILMEDTSDENVLRLYEQYADQAGFDAHGASDQMKALGAAIGPHLVARPELHFCNPLRGKGLIAPG